ncbi:MAG: ABC transporter substrate-binding protein [Acidimicrobiia bacterium]
MRFSRALSAAIVAVIVVTTGATFAGATAPQAEKPKAADVGITDTEIRLAVIADVETAVMPGLFKSAVDAVQAWAKIVNKQGGIAGRKVVIDFIDSKLSPDEARNGVIQACGQDFAMVGSAALFLNNVDDMTACPDAQGNPVGLPDIPGLALDVAQKCSPTTYVITGDTSFCATRDEHPQTYLVQQGDFRYYLKQDKDLHGIFTVPADLKATRDAQIAVFEAGVELGIKKDGEGFYDVSGRATQSVMTPIVQVMKDNSSTFAYGGSSYPTMVLLRREAKLQGVSSVTTWACNQGCYDAGFLDQGGADVEDTHSLLTTLPFYTEYKSNPTLKAIVREMGGVENLNGNAVSALTAALLFESAAEKASAAGTLTRQSLLDALKNEHAFDAKGIIGPTDVGNHQPQRCIVIAKVENGEWVREYPKKAGAFDCSKKNIKEIQLDLLT